jgi:hypothetical protein
MSFWTCSVGLSWQAARSTSLLVVVLWSVGPKMIAPVFGFNWVNWEVPPLASWT